MKTPCIGVCSTGIGDRVCRGCKRFAHEVIHWNSYTGEQKQLIEQRLADFLSRCVQNKLQVTDSQRLRSQLDAWRVPPFPRPGCQLLGLFPAQSPEPARLKNRRNAAED